MADVDDEFLALVGGDESSDEEFNQAENPDDSGSREASESPLPDDKNTKKSESTPKSRKRGQDDSEEEEEGEAYVHVNPLFSCGWLLCSSSGAFKVDMCVHARATCIHAPPKGINALPPQFVPFFLRPMPLCAPKFLSWAIQH